VPFLLDESDAAAAAASVNAPLPEPAARAAEGIGRVAASAKHAVTGALKKFGA
jgi:hypothetical protein